MRLERRLELFILLTFAFPVEFLYNQVHQQRSPRRCGVGGVGRVAPIDQRVDVAMNHLHTSFHQTMIIIIIFAEPHRFIEQARSFDQLSSEQTAPQQRRFVATVQTYV